MEFSEKEKSVMSRIQRNIPLESSPFKKIADELHMDEEEVLGIIDSLKKQGIVRDISAIFNASSIGYQSTLVAFHVPKEKVESAAAIINSHPGVSHNYLRDHQFNIWFTLAVREDLEKTVSTIAGLCGVSDFLILMSEQMYKLHYSVDFDETEAGTGYYPGSPSTHVQPAEGKDLSEEDLQVVQLLQTDLPIVKNPFREILQKGRFDGDEKKFIDLSRDLLARGIIRRYAAVLKHTRAGYRANAMVVWKFNGTDTENSVIPVFSNNKKVSHLYRRTVYPGKWEYSLYSMIHAKDGDELNKTVEEISRTSGLREYSMLHSLKEFKKSRVKYFSPDFEKWNDKYLTGA